MAMKRWEYAVADNPERLNEWGLNGWELAGVSTKDGRELFYMKRPLPSLREQVTLEQREQVLKQTAGGTGD